jgi:predicted DNA-binding transcriptional regulator YafY
MEVLETTKMPKRTGRLLAILQTLRVRKRPVTAIELARQFDLSDRTIYRDIGTLRELGAPIEGEAGVGFILKPGFFLPPLALTDLEADALLLGLRFVAKRADQELADAAGTTLGKIAAILDPETERVMRTNGLAVGPTGRDEAELIGRVRKAIAGERKVRIIYRDTSERVTERIVWPTALGFFAETEIMVAWCECREAFRHFRLDRITSFHALEDRLPRPRRVLLAEYHAAEPEADI